MERIVLKNGLRILLEADNRANTAHFIVFIGSGSRYEQPENGGVSHFIEHILFKGTAQRSSLEISEAMDYIGARYNAFTTKQHTCFYSSVLSKHLLTAMDIMFDMVSRPALRPEDIELEKGVITEEIGMCEDNPEDVLIDGTHAAIWRKSALGANILGTRETVASMTAEKIREYMKFAYAPERIVISVSGNFEREAVLEKINEYFGDFENTHNPISCEKADYFPSVFTQSKDFEQLNLLLGFNVPHRGQPYYYALKILSNVLGGSSSSRLFRKIREESGLAYSVGTGSDDYANESFLSVMMGISGENEAEVLKMTYEILCDVRDNGITQNEFDRVKNNINASIYMNDDSPAARASQYGRSELLYNKVVTYPEIAHIYEAVTLEEVNAAAKKYIDFSTASFGIVGKVPHSSEQYADFLKNGTISKL